MQLSSLPRSRFAFYTIPRTASSERDVGRAHFISICRRPRRLVPTWISIFLRQMVCVTLHLTSVFGPAGKVSGTDVFEMLTGGLYLQHHYDEKNPLRAMKGTEIWAYDPVKKVYTNNYFNSTGEFGSGTCTVNGNTWTFTGSAV